MSSTAVHAQDYTATITIPGDLDAVYTAITTTDGLAGWWNPVTGSGHEGGRLQFDMSNPAGPLVIDVHAAAAPHTVLWEVVSCPFLTDWEATTLTFDLGRTGQHECDLFFRHHGLTPQLECYDTCQRSWTHYLDSLRDYVTSGTGTPLGSTADTTWRRAGKPVPD